MPFAFRIREDKAGRFFYDMNAIRRDGEDAAARKAGRLSPEEEHGPGVAAAPDGKVSTPDPDSKFSQRFEKTGTEAVTGGRGGIVSLVR